LVPEAGKYEAGTVAGAAAWRNAGALHARRTAPAWPVCDFYGLM
jgi:hypothetical protein